MSGAKTDKAKPELDPSNLRLWLVVLFFLFLFQNAFVPKGVLVRFIDNLLFGLIFQFLLSLTEPWRLVQEGLTYLILAWLFLRAVHRPMGTMGASRAAWKVGALWGLGALVVGSVVLFLSGGLIAGFGSTPSLFAYLPSQLTQLFAAFGKELCYRAFLQTSVTLLAIRYLRNVHAATWIGIGMSTLFYTSVVIPEIAGSGSQGMALVGAVIHQGLIFALLVSLVYAVTNNLVLVAFIHGGYQFISYWIVDGMYPHYGADIFLVLVVVISLLAFKSNPKALEKAPLAAQVKAAT
jgi:hypothetical protein